MRNCGSVGEGNAAAVQTSLGTHPGRDMHSCAARGLRKVQVSGVRGHIPADRGHTLISSFDTLGTRHSMVA